jgi:hypothetical protein
MAWYLVKYRNNFTFYNILVGKPEGKRPLGKPSRRWEDIRMDLREIVWKSMIWLHLTQDPVAGSCEHGNKPSGSIKGGEFLD